MGCTQDENVKQWQEDLLGEPIEETFPASVPIASKQITESDSCTRGIPDLRTTSTG
jgi:hypothetical protein